MVRRVCGILRATGNILSRLRQKYIRIQAKQVLNVLQSLTMSVPQLFHVVGYSFVPMEMEPFINGDLS